MDNSKLTKKSNYIFFGRLQSWISDLLEIFLVKLFFLWDFRLWVQILGGQWEGGQEVVAWQGVLNYGRAIFSLANRPI